MSSSAEEEEQKQNDDVVMDNDDMSSANMMAEKEESDEEIEQEEEQNDDGIAAVANDDDMLSANMKAEKEEVDEDEDLESNDDKVSAAKNDYDSLSANKLAVKEEADEDEEDEEDDDEQLRNDDEITADINNNDTSSANRSVIKEEAADISSNTTKTNGKRGRKKSEIWNWLVELGEDHAMKAKGYTHQCKKCEDDFFLKLSYRPNKDKTKKGSYINTVAVIHMKKYHPPTLVKGSKGRRGRPRRLESSTLIKSEVESDQKEVITTQNVRPKRQYRKRRRASDVDDSFSTHCNERERELALNERERQLDRREEQLQLAQLEQKVTKLEEKLEEEAGDKSSEQVITLNIGGEGAITTLRSTLMSVPGSILASQFGGQFDHTLPRDKDGNFFIDQPIDFFKLMINQLRIRMCEAHCPEPTESPNESWFGEGPMGHAMYKNFKSMVEYYGVTSAIFPTELIMHQKPNSNDSNNNINNNGNIESEDNTKKMVNFDRCSGLQVDIDDPLVFELRPRGHQRRIWAFEVIVKKFITLEIGWLDPSITCAVSSCVKSLGTHGSNIITLDCNRSQFIFKSMEVDSADGSLQPTNQVIDVEDLSIRKGSTVRCEMHGENERSAWFVDGREVIGSPTILPQNACSRLAVPAFCGTGKWKVTKVEFGP